MKTRCIIKGTNRVGDKVRLILSPDDAVQEKPNIMSGIMGNPQGMMDKMQQDALLKSQPDTVTISFEEWQKHQYKIDDVIWLEVSPEK